LKGMKKIDKDIRETDPRGRLLSKREVAGLLNLSVRTIDNLQRRGLPYMRIGPRRNRYDAAEVMAWVKEHFVVRRRGKEHYEEQ